jgi:hypothetical protein
MKSAYTILLLIAMLSLHGCSGKQHKKQTSLTEVKQTVESGERNRHAFFDKIISAKRNAYLNHCHNQGFILDLEYINMGRAFANLDDIKVSFGLIDINNASRVFYDDFLLYLETVSSKPNFVRERCINLSHAYQKIYNLLKQAIDDGSHPNIKSMEDIQYSSADSIDIYFFNGVKAITVSKGDKKDRYAVDIHGYIRMSN